MAKRDVEIAELQQALRQSQSELQIEIRGPVDGGLSGADVLFVDYSNEGQQQHGIIKVTSPDNALKEKSGDEKARASWLAPYLPTHFSVLAPLPGTGKVPLLFSLAKDRSDNCQTLFTTLHDSYPYARDYVLFAVAWVYRNVAASQWVHPHSSP